MWQILYGKRRTKKFINITSFLNSNPRGSEKLGVQLASFNIDIAIPEDENGDYLDIKMGDRIVITKDETYKEVIRAGIIEEPSAPLIGWDYDKDEWRKSYSLQVKQKDFSIDKFSIEYENILLSELIQIILTHSSNELGFLKSNGVIVPKFKLICTDRIIPYVNITNKKALDHISTICKENSLFLRLDSYSDLDTENLIKLYYQLVILDESGETPLSIQAPSITDEVILKGLYPNPNYFSSPETEPEYLFGYTLPITKNDNANEYKNYISIKSKVIANNGYLKRWTTSAIDGVREYPLPSYANKIVYVSNNLLKLAKVNYSYEARNKIRLHSHDAVHVKANDIVRIVSKDRVTESIRSVVSINVYANDTIVLDSDIDFDIENGETFEVISNVPIYEEGHPSLNFERIGVKVTCNTDEKAKIEFLEFSEPQGTNEICVYYQEIKDLPIISSNPTSIQDIGVRDIDFSISKALTQEQVNEIRRSIENVIESESLNINAWLHILPKVGWNLNVNLKNYMNKNLKIVSYNWVYYSSMVDNDKDVINQTIDLSEKIFSIEEYLKRFDKKEPKNTNLSIEKFTKNIRTFSDKLSILDFDPIISKNFKPPVLTDYEFILDNALTINWESYSESINFYIQLSLNSDFTNIVSEGFTGNETSITIVADYIENNNNFYARLKVKNLVNTSGWSEPLEITKRVESYYFISTENLGYEELLYTDLDGTNQNDILTMTHARRPIDFAVNDDYIAIEQHGYLDVYGNLAMTLFNKNTGVSTNIDLNTFSYFVQKPVIRNGYLYYARNGGNIYKYNLATGVYTPVYNSSYMLEDVSFDERYLLLATTYNRYVYDTVTASITNTVYHSWFKGKFLPNNKLIISASNGSFIFNDPSNVASSYSLIPNTLSNGYVSDVVSNTEFITSGNGSDGNRIARHFDIDGNLLKSVTLGSTGHVYSVKIAKKYIP